MTVLVVLPAGCEMQPVERPERHESIEKRPALRTGWKEGGGMTFGSVEIIPEGLRIGKAVMGGKRPNGPFEVCDAVWQDEKHWLLLCIANYPGKRKGPVALVIARNPPDSKGTRNVSDSDNIFTIQTNLGSNQALVVWALRKDITESMQIGGKQFDLNKGRVFLVDAVGQSISAHQIKADLGGTFDDPGPDFEKLGTELESLLEKDVKVKRFWMGEHPDAEDS